MSKLIGKLAFLELKGLVNVYTWSTLPFYALAQRPWTKLRLAKNLGVQSRRDKLGRTIYTRPSHHLKHHFNQYKTFPEIFPLLDRSREVVGIRDILSEHKHLEEDGNPVKIDGKELTKLKLADQFRWLTVGQVLDRVDAIAKGLREVVGVKKGDHVLIYAENGIEWFYTCLALARINAVTVTLFSTLGKFLG